MVPVMPERDVSEISPPGSIQVVSRTASVLRELAANPGGMSLTQLARAVSLPRSTVHRLLAALNLEGLVTTNIKGLSVLGPELLRIAGRSPMDLNAVLRPVLEDLFDDLDETVDLAALEGDHLRFVDQIQAPHRLRAISSVGAQFPLHCTANGKAVLANMTDEQIKRLLPEKLERFTETTITSRTALLEEVATIRDTGFAIDREEHTEGICAIGFAVAIPGGDHFAITVPVPRQRFVGREGRIAAALEEARHAALRTLPIVEQREVMHA